MAWMCASALESSGKPATMEADSLRRRIASDATDVESLCRLGLLSLRMVDEKTASECGESLLQLSGDRKGQKGETAAIYGNTILGQAELMKSDHPKALKYLTKARTLAELKADSMALASIYNGLAIYTYQYVGDIPEAIQYYHKGLRAAKAAGKIKVYYSLLNNIANAHIELGDTLGLPYARQCYEYAKDTGDNYLHYASSLCLADTYFLTKDYTRALRYVNEAESELDSINGYQPSLLYDLKGRLQGAIGNYDASRKNFRRAKDLAINTKDWYMSFLANEAEMEISSGRLERASLLLDSVLNLGENPKDAHVRLKALNLKSIVAEKSGDYRQALAYERAFSELAKRTTHMKTMRMMSEAQTRTGLDDMTAELAKQRIDTIKHQRNFNISMIAVIALVIVVCGLYYFTMRLRRLHGGLVNQMRMALQREESLKAQIAEQKSTFDRADGLDGHTPTAEERGMEYDGAIDQDTASSRPSGAESAGLRSSRSIMDEIEDLFSCKKAYKDCNLTRDDIAEAIGTNPSYVTRAIQECCHMNLKQYLNNYRIHEAIRILSDPDDDTPLKTLGSDIGYSSITSFYNHFKEATGMTPAAYRAAAKTANG